MCGIVGHAGLQAPQQASWVSPGCLSLAHRGPDADGLWQSADGRVVLGHRRLAVIDLSDAARQPMSRGSLCIVFNGEIYNFAQLRRELQDSGVHFVTHSDTEVVLAAYERWGDACIDKLHGMFAFALYDSAAGAAGRLLLARDRVGEKPLFFRHDGAQLRFASELKGLLEDAHLPRRLSRAALDCYLGLGFVPGEGCILEGFAKLPPAHAMSFEVASGQLRRWCYWQLPEPPVQQSESDDELLTQLQALLGDAVRRQMVADVPVGVLLSGGVDSSLITALAAQSTGRLHTFNVSFPGSGRLDESAHARLIASHFGTEHTEIEAESASVDLLSQLAQQFDEPLIDSSMLPTYAVTRVIRRHCTVAIGGDGGDELFGGYSHYSRLLALQRHAAVVPLWLRRPLSRAGARLMPSGAKGRNWLQAAGADFEHEVPLVASYFDRRQRLALLGPCALAQDEAAEAWRMATAVPGDLLQRATRADFATYLPDDILVKVDRASMLNSLEVRAPFLDHHVVEFAFGRVPTRCKATRGARKMLLKALAKRLLPPQFDLQRKQGFSIPIAEWLAQAPWRDFFRAHLLGREASVFDRREVERLFAGQERGRNNGERLFGLLMFELWRKRYGVSA